MVVAYTNSNFHSDQNLTEYSANGNTFTTAKTFTMTVNAGTVLKGFYLKYDLRASANIGVQTKVILTGSGLGTYYATTTTEREYLTGGFTYGQTYFAWGTVDTAIMNYPSTSYSTRMMHVIDPLLLSTDTSITVTVQISGDRGDGTTVYMRNVYFRWY